MPLPRPGRTATATLLVAVLLAAGGAPMAPLGATPARAQVQATPRPGAGSGADTSLEQAAQKAGDTGRTVAISLLGLAFAIAAVILVFKRDFKEAAAIFGVGLLGVLLATPAGLNMLNDLVATLFGGR